MQESSPLSFSFARKRIAFFYCLSLPPFFFSFFPPFLFFPFSFPRLQRFPHRDAGGGHGRAYRPAMCLQRSSRRYLGIVKPQHSSAIPLPLQLSFFSLPPRPPSTRLSSQRQKSALPLRTRLPRHHRVGTLGGAGGAPQLGHVGGRGVSGVGTRGRMERGAAERGRCWECAGSGGTAHTARCVGLGAVG